MKRYLALAYGLVCYAIFFGTFLYAIGFLGNLWVPRTIDSAPVGPLGRALAIDLSLLALFAVQHSLMARPAFKRWWTRFVPVPVERSTYVLFSSVALILLFATWQPLGGTIWSIGNPVGVAAMQALYFGGLLLVLVSTFLINHFDLFGLRQVFLYWRGQEYTPVRFVQPGPYRLVRHPLYVGWLFTFWAAPVMSAAHFVMAVAITAYILVAIQLEERDLEAEHGGQYASYRRSVPMLVPSLRRRRPVRPETERAAA